jgi:hypothetical protein
MPNILIRDIPADDLERLDRRAHALGISRNEYLRRHLSQLASAERKVTVDDLERAADLARDLLDENVMRGAWR